MNTTSIRKWFDSGEPWIWLNAAAVSASLIIVVGLLSLIAVRGLAHFWPARVMEADYAPGKQAAIRVIGEIVETESTSAANLRSAGHAVEGEGEVLRHLVKTGNRDSLGGDFRWLIGPALGNRHYPPALLTVERREWGNFYGYPSAIRESGTIVAEGDAVRAALEQRLQRALALFADIRRIEKNDIGEINYALEELRLQARRLELSGESSPELLETLNSERARLQTRYEKLQSRLAQLYRDINRDSLAAEIMDGRIVEIPLAKIVRVYAPNELGMPGRLGVYFARLWEFVADEPREANTEGGIFPAIFGTVMMVIIMSILVTPFGVIAAVYLREYARQGVVTRTIRIAVNNLAGVPSIVYGVFGLGFFVYFLGGNIDRLFYPEALPAPTFGTPGILWSSLTLAILTVPVVIVATEEGLSRIPRAIREGSLALGATKAETLWRTVLPMATPAMMTGLILAVARAAGEVAPLMLVGVVKLAPSLPLDANAPFLHLDRKFMHLGFHIYDVGFQSPNVEAARPLVYATALLLVLVIVALNLAAIWIRNRLRERYRALDH